MLCIKGIVKCLFFQILKIVGQLVNFQCEKFYNSNFQEAEQCNVELDQEIKTVTSDCNMADYFTLKMQNLSKKSGKICTNTEEIFSPVSNYLFLKVHKIKKLFVNNRCAPVHASQWFSIKILATNLQNLCCVSYIER